MNAVVMPLSDGVTAVTKCRVDMLLSCAFCCDCCVVVVVLAVVVCSSDCWHSLLCRCYTSMDHIHFVGHTIGLFHPVSAPVVFQTCCRLLSYSLLPYVQVDHKCNNLTLDSFLFVSVVLCSCLFLCLLWLVVLAAIVACLFLYCYSFLCPFLCLCLGMLLQCPLVLFRHQGYCWQLMIVVAILWKPLWFCSTPWLLLILLRMLVMCRHWDVGVVVVALVSFINTAILTWSGSLVVLSAS